MTSFLDTNFSETETTETQFSSEEDSNDELTSIYFITVDGVKVDQEFQSYNYAYRYVNDIYKKLYLIYSDCNLYYNSYEGDSDNVLNINITMTQKNSLYAVEKHLCKIEVEEIKLFKA